ncbi:MAG TPA: response regulator [Mycobacteriales bacterium]|nr:response regulator [Mycobacteriales bacterium]
MTTVLVVDDAADIRLLQRAILGRSGFSVVEAAGGPDALAALATEPLPDAVVLDVQMPVMDGWETLAAIRADPRLESVPVIMCTVKALPADTERAWRAGCDGYLSKPFAIGRLVEEVQTALARTVQQREAVRRAWLSTDGEATHD